MSPFARTAALALPLCALAWSPTSLPTPAAASPPGAAVAPTAQDPAAPPAVAVGAAAPAFRVNDHEGRATTVGGERETWTVLAFFPKAATPGWTKEMCSLRDAATDFAGLAVRVFGVSRDDVASLAAFHAAQKLTFTLLSDPDGSVTDKYGVAMDGRPFSKRVTFVVDAKGVVRHISDKVDVAAHGEEVVALLRRLRGD